MEKNNLITEPPYQSTGAKAAGKFKSLNPLRTRQSALHIFTHVPFLFYLFAIFCFGCALVDTESTPHPSKQTVSESNYNMDPNTIDSEIRAFLDQTGQQRFPEALKTSDIGDGFALLVGVDNTNVATFDNLDYSVEEVESVRRCFQASNYRVKTLVNEQATAGNIRKWLSALSRLTGRNRFIFYFSGHGATFQDFVKSANIISHRAFIDIQHRIEKSIHAPLICEKLKSKPDEALIRRDAAFFMIPYQPPIKNSSGPFSKLREVLGYDEIACILSSCDATEKIIIIDACRAGQPKPAIFTPLISYAYGVRRQSFAFLTMVNPNEEMKIYQGVFTPVIATGLDGAADVAGDDDGIVTAFELIRYANQKWHQLQSPWGQESNRMNHMLFGSEDIPLTVVPQGRSRP